MESFVTILINQTPFSISGTCGVIAFRIFLKTFLRVTSFAGSALPLHVPDTSFNETSAINKICLRARKIIKEVFRCFRLCHELYAQLY